MGTYPSYDKISCRFLSKFNQGKKMETIFADYNGPIYDSGKFFWFFIDPNGKIDHLIGDSVREDID